MVCFSKFPTSHIDRELLVSNAAAPIWLSFKPVVAAFPTLAEKDFEGKGESDPLVESTTGLVALGSAVKLLIPVELEVPLDPPHADKKSTLNTASVIFFLK
ncbi:MAG: hypothetical protein COV43_00525 [Deltaproteobacteria bacterium CG11_big_fil_rev_8_21_14_0_20_42_23]|nr:MAG: hypothetical protein COV43_00525 [Deltaproteobacteria bacterium CG11_big_fil_rev_8_21_14_0_20_42_23]PJC63853.1 MAG: hypothetical protein CO021_07315 [Deltaproteobacteria bacterium CG_4_9_14_0_2_um_filter_42_21]